LSISSLDVLIRSVFSRCAVSRTPPVDT
jgi:hypothetical protein